MYRELIDIGLFIALCDETIQLFTVGRNGQITGVWIDTAGVSAGSLIILVSRILRRQKS